MPALLVCTVGGSPEAVAAAVKGCKPQRVVFVVSPETRNDVREKVLPLAMDEAPLSPGQYDYLEIADAQDLAHNIERMRTLDMEVEKWLARGAGYEVVADITGGTKCMSAALALVARRWPCLFSYVGGTERTKGGVGVVVNGQERVLHTHNPWDSLGYQAAEEAIVLFDKGDYGAAIDVLDAAFPKIERSHLKEELRCLRLLAEAYLAWDLFDHKAARQKLGDVQKNANNLSHLLGPAAGALLHTVEEHRAFLAPWGKGTPGRHMLLDLCANARRCAQRGRYDDAVARLYRALEANAQLRLSEIYSIPSTSSVPLEKVPQPLRKEWATRAKEGRLLLGLQDAYRLLEALDDKLGPRFTECGLSGGVSPLGSRNQSILAHGFIPVGKEVFQRLWDATVKLAGMAEDGLVRFPRIRVS